MFTLQPAARAIALPVLALVLGCNRQPETASIPQPKPDVIASVEGLAISTEHFTQKLTARLRHSAKQPNSEKEAVLEELIRHESVYAQAKAARFNEDPEIAAAIKNLIVSRYIERNLDSPEPPVSEQDIARYFQRHRHEFTNPERARAAIIFLRASSKITSPIRAELRAKAEAILTEARHNDFVRLAQQHSEHAPTRYQGGDLGFMTKAQSEAALGPQFTASLFSLQKPNALAPIVETPEGFYILKLLERREQHLKSLREVEPLIRHRLARERKFERDEEFYTRMKSGLNIEINRPLLESISITAPHKTPPGGTTMATR